MRFRQRIPPFSQAQITAIAKVLGETDGGLKGTEIAHYLAICKIPDVAPDITKWKRLHDAFCMFQNEHQVGNHIVVFINKVMEPALYTKSPEIFRKRQADLNMTLSLCGLRLNASGQVVRVPKTETLDQAVAVAARMKAELERRGVHQEVLRFCNAEVLAENYFHAVVEAMKSVTSRIRALSGLDGDGSALVDAAFGFSLPRLPVVAINGLDTSTRQGEQRGFINLLKGIYGTFRNPVSHEAKIEWEMTEQDALDLMTTISLIHRKLDRAQRTPS